MIRMVILAVLLAAFVAGPSMAIELRGPGGAKPSVTVKPIAISTKPVALTPNLAATS